MIVESPCPFCQRIAAGDFEAVRERVALFEPLSPVTLGHMLFVPREHIEHTGRSAVTALVRCMAAAERRGKSQGEQFNLITSSGPAATQSIAHLHVHYVPRREDDGLHLPWTGQVRQ